MIQIDYCRAGNRHRLTIEGHAGYAEYGQDIVCAGVSAVSFALLEYLGECGANIDDFTGDTGKLAIKCVGGDGTSHAFAMALCGYRRIAQNYPQCVEVHITAESG